ncbi:CYIR protein, partial [Plasmodium cynomolgi strain B]
MTKSDLHELPSANFIKALTGIHTEKNDHKDHPLFFHKHCYDLNYWLYNEVTTQFGDHKTKKYIYHFFEKIQKQWNDIDRNGESNKNGKICNPESEHFKTELFKYIKKLLDYLENFETFKNEMETKKTEIKETKPYKYCDNIKECVPLYFTFKKLCELIKNDICTKYVQNYD